MTWGFRCFGGDSSAVQDQLKIVQQIQSNYGAFAAIRGDGRMCSRFEQMMGPLPRYVVMAPLRPGAKLASVVTAVQSEIGLQNVRQIRATGEAFAAILGDGSVATWGFHGFGGDSSAVQDQLKTVQQIQSNYRAFAAIRGDGSVVTRGNADAGGDSSAVRDQLQNVQQIEATHRAFAAILGDGSVVTWSDADFGGDSSAVRHQLI